MARRRFDPRRQEEVLNLPMRAVVRELVEIMGSRRVVAVLAGLRSVRDVSAWMNQDQPPRPERAIVLRTALQAARLIADLESVDSARAWFVGTNTHFKQEAPIMVLRERGSEACPDIMRAAHAFVADAMAAAEIVEYEPAYA